MKKLLSIITAMVMIFCLMPPPITAEAAPSITYREYAADGSYTEKTLQEDQYLDCLNLEELEDNTYFYSDDYTPNKLTIKGNVNLILPAGSVFEVKQYITMEPDAVLNIYGAGTLITGQFNYLNNDCNVNLHGANVKSGFQFNANRLTVNAGKLSAMGEGVVCTDLIVNGGTVEAESSVSPAISVNGTFTVGKNGSVSGYSSDSAAFSKIPTVNYSDDIIVSYGDNKFSYSPSSNKTIDDDLISRHYVSIESGKKFVEYIKREYSDDTGVTDTPRSAPTVKSISSFSQPSVLSGWYYVDGNVDLNYRPVIYQTACIILTDGSTLNANCGIELPEGCTLEIYGQENGTGTIKSSLTNIDGGDAFIGGDQGEKCGTLKLFGGNIKTDYNSNYYNDLIGNGGGIARGDGAVYVYGGSIDAKANGASITANLNIYGGSVTAFSYNAKALYSVPAFGKDFTPKVSYGSSETSPAPAVKIVPDDKVYTSNKYVSIENAVAATNYEYCKYDWDGSKLTRSIETQNCTTLDSAYFPTTLNSGWYAVEGKMFSPGQIEINGTVNLILTDDCSLTFFNQGIGLHVKSGSTLNIYGQKKGTGKIATATNNTAIGSDSGEACGELNIHGGIIGINALSDIAIGGSGAVINIYNGGITFDAQKTSMGGNGSKISIYGGDVEAKSMSASAITVGASGKTVIYGGSVIANVHGSYPAFDYAPTFDAGYIPKVSYGESESSVTVKIDPDDGIYTSNKYVSIEKADITADYEYCKYDWDGSKLTSSIETQNCTTLNSEYFPKTLSTGWYAVKGDVTVSDRIEISGNVNLILTDGCKLTADEGIHLPENAVLNIYAQSEGSVGTLQAKSRLDTAIGGDSDESCGTLNIHGGQVNAEASETAIGGGGNSTYATAGNGGTINVYGGQVNAESRNNAAIGGGFSTAGTGGNGGTISVYGGEVIASSESNAAIGGGFSTSGTGGSGSKLTVYGGKVSAKSSQMTAIGGGRITSGTAGNPGTTHICGGSLIAYVIMDNNLPAFDHVPTYDADYVPKVTFGASPTNSATKISPDPTVYTGNCYVSIEPGNISSGNYKYCGRSWNGSSVVSSIETANCTTLDNTYFPTALSGGWYAVSGNVTISDRITVSGEVHLILLDGCTLNAEKGINIPESAILNIYGQSGGTGTLTANGDFGYAGIGGNASESCGTLNIFGGQISAASYSGAGIGSDNDNENADGGTVNIYGGKVIASSEFGAGIGGGQDGIHSMKGSAGSELTIYGGDVTASSKQSPAIGGPFGGDGGSLAFYGGTLTAYSETSISIGSGSNEAISSKGADTVVTVDKGVKIYTSPSADGSGKALLTGYTDLGAELAKYKYAQFTINLCDHSANTNPTCEGAECSVCGEYIAPTGHKNGEPVTENRTFTSCTEGGSYDEVVYCSVCGKEISRENKTIEPSEHTAGTPVIENEAADGSYDEVVYCSVCGTEMSRERKIKAAHVHVEGMADVITMPTFTSAGSRVFRCTLCGEIIRTETIPPITTNFTTDTESENNASQVIYTAFPELKFNVEIKDGKAVISWDKVETADRYVVYAVKDGKTSEIAKTKKTSFEVEHQSGTSYLVRYMKNGVLSPKPKSVNVGVTSDKPMVAAISGKDFIRLEWQDMKAEKYNIYKYVDGKAIKIGEVKRTSVKIKNLTPDTEYKFIVTATIDGKETAMLKSDILTVKTKKA